jgi:hypothetical protein
MSVDGRPAGAAFTLERKRGAAGKMDKPKGAARNAVGDVKTARDATR